MDNTEDGVNQRRRICIQVNPPGKQNAYSDRMILLTVSGLFIGLK
jgi:hypothetical protein